METAYESACNGSAQGRAEMLEGACMAGIAFNMTGTAAVHALSYIFSEEWHIPHGIACAFTLDDIFRLNSSDENTCRKLANVAEAVCGKADVALLLDKITTLKKRFGLPSTFADLHIELEISRIEELFYKTLDDPKMKNNIIPFDRQTVFELIKRKIR